MGFRLESSRVHMLIATFSMLVPALCILIYDRLPYKEEKSGESWQLLNIIYYYILCSYIYYFIIWTISLEHAQINGL